MNLLSTSNTLALPVDEIGFVSTADQAPVLEVGRVGPGREYQVRRARVLCRDNCHEQSTGWSLSIMLRLFSNSTH